MANIASSRDQNIVEPTMIRHFMQAICTLEGTVGFLLNASLFYYLHRSRTRPGRIFQVPIYISACVGLYLCFSIAVMNFTHIFRDGTLNVVLLSPLAEYFPTSVRDLMFEAAFVLMSLMWSFTPATCLLQLSVLARQTSHWGNTKKLIVSFAFTVICLVFVAYTVPMIMPSRELALIMERSMKELFEIPEEQFVQTYGISITYENINDDKSMLTFILMFVVIPYIISYTIIIVAMRMIRKRLFSNGMALSARTIKMQHQFFVMQLLQCILPLVILSVPVGIVTYGTIANADLGLATLPLTAFVWLCPVAQSAVQVRYVRHNALLSTPASSQAIATSKVSTISVARVSVMS